MKAPKILLYSPPGVGKTHFLGSGAVWEGKGKDRKLSVDPRMHPMIVLDFEGGMAPIESRVRYLTTEILSDPKFKPSPIDIFRVSDWQSLQAIYDWLFTNLVEKPGFYKCVAVDSLSELNYLNLQTAVEEEIRSSPKHDQDIPEQRDYLRSATQMRRFVRAFRDLPVTVIMTAHAKEERDPRSGLSQLRPNLVGKLPNELPGMLDIMGYLAIETATTDPKNPKAATKTVRVLYTQPTPTLMAKDRSEGGKLGAEILNPTLPRIFDLLEIEA